MVYFQNMFSKPNVKTFSPEATNDKCQPKQGKNKHEKYNKQKQRLEKSKRNRNIFNELSIIYNRIFIL